MTDDVSKQREMNRQTWAALQESGVHEGQPLEVDAFFYASDESSSSALTADLRARGWRADTSQIRQGLLKKRTVWAVQGTKTLPAAELAAFDRMVEELEELAAMHRAEFDGWGAEAPA